VCEIYKQLNIMRRALLGFYATRNVNLPTFRDNLTAPISGLKNEPYILRMVQICCPETSAKNHLYPEDCADRLSRNVG
jgi:hypothetical protein